jgi:hypothetical protein
MWHEKASKEWVSVNAVHFERMNFYNDLHRATRQIEADRRASLDNLLTLQRTVGELERKLAVAERWTPDSQEWKDAQKMENEWDYLQALQKLEAVAVARLFELSKAFQSGTGKCLALY